jgi:hypothetical protein
MALTIFIAYFWIFVAIGCFFHNKYKKKKLIQKVRELDENPKNPIKSDMYLKEHNTTVGEENIKAFIVQFKRIKYTKKYVTAIIQNCLNSAISEDLYGYPQYTDAKPIVEKYWDLIN